MRGGGLSTVTRTDSFSTSSASGSAIDGCTSAEFTMSVLFGTGQITFAINVISPAPPPATVLKEPKRLAPDPPHAPPAVALHDTNVVSAGSSSMIVNGGAASPPSLNTVIV